MALRSFPLIITLTYGQHFLYPRQFAENYVHSILYTVILVMSFNRCIRGIICSLV